MDEQHLSEGIKRGDKKVFEEVYYLYQKRILFFINQYVKDIDVAYDLTQDTFISLWQYRENLYKDIPLVPYLSTIAKNKALNYLRRTINSRDINVPMDRRETYAQYCALSDSTADMVTTEEIGKIVDRALEKVPGEYRRVFLMSRKKNLKYEEIALLCDVSIKTVEYRISSVLRVLRKYLKDYIHSIMILLFLLGGIQQFVYSILWIKDKL